MIHYLQYDAPHTTLSKGSDCDGALIDRSLFIHTKICTLSSSYTPTPLALTS